MKTSNTSLLALTCAGAAGLSALSVNAAFVHADVQMQKIQWTPAAGSSLNWATDWELMASASSYDSTYGSTMDYQFNSGQPSLATANALGAYSSASSSVSVDGTGNNLLLQAVMDITYPPGLLYASSFSTAMAYREFTITGGTGPVSVQFSYDYLAHLQGDAVGQGGADYRAILSITDGSTVWGLAQYQARNSPMNETFSGVEQDTFSLQYDTPYSITLSVDPNPIPESGTVLSGLLCCLLLLARRRAVVSRQ